jgi:hypothetical protein
LVSRLVIVSFDDTIHLLLRRKQGLLSWPFCTIRAIELSDGDGDWTDPLMRCWIAFVSYRSLSDCMADIQQPLYATQQNLWQSCSLWSQFSITMLTSTRLTEVQALIVGWLFTCNSWSHVVRWRVLE